MSFFNKLKQGLKKTQSRLSEGLGRVVLGKKEIDDNIAEELEEILIEADIGLSATEEILEMVTGMLSRKELKDKDALTDALKQKVQEMVTLGNDSRLLEDAKEKPLIALVVGVNGVGKTTSIGKLAANLSSKGKKVILGAADTFRAAAIEQLSVWSDRANVEIVKHMEGSDPSAVAFDAVKAGVARNADLVLIDTAGRLHTKDNLMAQLEKMKRVIAKVIPDAPHRVILVLDGTNGQNALSQAKEFQKITGITDIVLTKLDGTAKGGAIIPIIRELQVPVSYVGVGEQTEDLIPFVPNEYAELLFKD
jgi:fused signal recognition particle receptor